MSQASVSHSSVLLGNIFGKRKNLQNRKTKRAKTSVTAELCHYTQVRKVDPVLRMLHFLSLLRREREKKKSAKEKKVP